MDRQRLFNSLCRDEGVRYEIYKDHRGYYTFGIGHLIIKGDPEFEMPLGTSISRERVEEAFEKDILQSIHDVHVLYSPNFDFWPEEAQEVMINMAFNLGRTRLSKFKRMKEALMQYDWKTAALEGRDSSWYKQVSNRAERLMKILENIE